MNKKFIKIIKEEYKDRVEENAKRLLSVKSNDNDTRIQKND